MMAPGDLGADGLSVEDFNVDEPGAAGVAVGRGMVGGLLDGLSVDAGGGVIPAGAGGATAGFGDEGLSVEGFNVDAAGGAVAPDAGRGGVVAAGFAGAAFDAAGFATAAATHDAGAIGAA